MPNIYDQFDEKATANPYDQFDLPPKPEESAWGGLKRGATEAFQQLPQLGAGLVAGAGALAESALGEGGIATGIKKAGIKGYDDWGKKIADKAQESDSWNYSYDKAKEGDFGALVNWVVHGLGYVGGQAIQTLATGGIGAVGGKFVASTAAKQIAEGMVAKEAASIAASEAGKTLAADAVAKLATANVAAKFATIGQTAAVGASAFGMEGGEIFGGLTSENNDRALTGSELGKAFAATLGAGALEFVGDKVGLDIMLGKSKLLKPAASLTGFGGAAARAGVAAAGAAPIEAGTEFAQTLAEEYGKGKDPFSEASLAQARDGAALGALGGAAMGSVGGIIHGAKAPAAPTPAAMPETPETLQLGNTPDPLLSFPDGTVGRRSEVDAYINSLPEADRVAARAKLSGLAPQPADIMADNVTSVDHAIALAQGALATTPTARMGTMTTASVGPGFDARSVAPGYFDQQELDGLVASEQRNLQVMQAQIEQDRVKQAQMNQIPGIAADQDVVAGAVQRAAVTEAPNAMSAAFNRLADKTIGPDPVAEAPAVPVPKPEAQPRIVPRFDGAVTMPLELAQLQVEMDGGEVVRVANRNGKYGYSVLKEKQAVSPVLPAQSAIETVAKEPAGREGYEKPFEVDAKALMAAFEKENGSALVWNNDKLNAVRGGAKSTGNIEAAINARGDIGINDGRHRIAVAAERGEKVTVFASEEDGLAILGKIKKSKPTDPRLIAKSTQSIDPEHLGRNSKPLAEGGKPFKTKDEAATAKKLQPMLRVIKTKGGFALAPKTEKQLAAEQQAAKRLGIARTGQAGVPTAAHEFIAGEGGMDASTKNEFSFGNNPRVGNRTLFAGTRGGLSLDAATEKLIEAGYLPQGATHSDTVALVNRSFTKPQYTADGTETTAQAEVEARFEDHLAAEIEASQQDDFDPFGPAPDNVILEDVGYTQAAAETQAEFRALISLADAGGIDAESIQMDVASQVGGAATEQDYYEAAITALKAAIEGSARNGSEVSGSESQATAGQETGEGLTAPTRAEVLAQQERADSATQAETAQRKAQDLADKRDRERKDIAKASEAAADTFVLGGDAEQNLSGQGSIFDEPAAPAPVSKTETTAKPVATETPAWHTSTPEKGVAFQLGDEKLDGSRMVLHRIATEAANALTQVQKMNGQRLYAYYLPSTATEHGAVRLFPDDQTPANPWTLLAPEGIAVGMMTPENLMAKLRDALQNARVLTSGDEKAMAEALKNPPKAKKAKTATTEAPAAKTPSAAELRAQADLQAALADLGDIFGKNTRMNMMPEQEAKILPVMVKLFDAAFRLGYIKFKDAAKFALDKIRAALGSEIADDLTLEHLQGAYISMSSGKTGVDGIRAVSNIEDKSEIESHTAQTDNERNGESNAPSTDSRVERDSPVASTEPAMGDTVSPESNGADAATAEAGGRSNRGEGRGQQNGAGVPFGSAPVAGERSDQRLHPVGEQPELTSIVTGADFREPGGDSGIARIPPEPIATAKVDAAATSRTAQAEAKLKQVKADKLPVTLGDIDSIRATLPQLLTGQQDDVKLAEDRFAKADGYGMLFTNGTGTGKTFSGLGIVKRFALQGKTDTLIVAPDSKISADWIESGKLMGLDITGLKDTKDAGKGIVITTYANLGENDQLARRQWSLVVADEAHSLMQAATGDPTGYLYNLRALTYHPDGAHTRHNMLNRDKLDQQSALGEEILALEKMVASDSTTHAQRNDWEAKSEKLQDELGDLRKELAAAQEAMRQEVDARQGADRTRLVALSATPFAYEKTIDWANGYLFDYNEGQSDESREFRGYNSGSNKDRYMMQNFGYSMRYNKMTRPDANVDTGLMQRQWNANLKKSGALSGRMLDVTPDYDRRFILVESAIGNRIDEALEWVSEQQRAEKGSQGPYTALSTAINEKFKYLEKRYLLEAIKATEVIPIVKQHMAMGRKVVVFHDYKKGGGFNPFRVNSGIAGIGPALDAFNSQFKDLVNAPLGSMPSPIDVFSRELPEVLLINGDEKKADLLARYKSFQNDANGPQVMLVQSAKNKGWSGHDTTGKHQRVLINLGQPTAPTLAIQQEGRIYRTGQASDAIMRYMNTGTNWERWTFATTIASRASTAENLGMGEMARALKDSFIQSFEESDTYAPGHEGEGKGGKERDKAANDAITEFDRAKTFYFGQQKKTSKTKAQEGADYFATPEPVGLKMTQWLDARGGEDVLEPSGGHGAIARWIPDNTKRTVIEPSLALRSRLSMVMNPTEDRIISGTFEEHHIGNKYDGIVMNPPFGSGGRTAIDHLAQAATHLRDGGRIVALIPTGPAADKKFDKWFYEESEKPARSMATHNTLGKMFKGDTLTVTDFMGRKSKIVLDQVVPGAGMQKFVKAKDGERISMDYVMEIAPTGKRTESYKPAEGLNLVATINLPSITFERAGTAVSTRVVVIEKNGANVMQRDRDLTDITDIKELFDRLENMDFPARSKPVEAAPAEPVKVEKPAKAEKAPKPMAHAGDEVVIGGTKYEIEIYTTSAGKEKRGVWMASKAEAMKYSARAFTHNSNKGKWFVDEYWFPKDAEVIKPEAGGSGLAAFKRSVNNIGGVSTQINAGQEAVFIHNLNMKLLGTGNTIHLVQSHSDLPVDVQKVSNPGDMGITHGRGDIYIIQGNIHSAKDFESTVIHELYGHIGLRSLFGKDLYSRLNKLSLTLGSSKIDDLIKKYKLDTNGYVKYASSIVTNSNMNRRAGGQEQLRQAWLMEEVLAHIAENETGSLKQMALEIVGSVKAWLRDNGFAKLAKLDMADIAHILKRARQEAFSTQGVSDLPAFSRTKIVGQTNRQHTAAQLQAMTNIGQQIEAPTLKERYQALTQDLGKKLTQGLADQFAPLKELGGSAYVLTRLAKGASGAFETLLNGGKLKLTDGVYDFDQANKGGVLDKLMLPLQGEHHDFLRWVAANRAEKLMAEGRENLFSPADIAALKTLKDGTTDFDYKLQHGPNAGTTTRNRALMYSDALATFNGFQKNVMDMYEQSGGVDPEARKAFESEFYLPFYRVSEEEGGMRGISVGSGIVRQDAIKKLKGGKDKLNFDLLDNTLMNWASLLEAGAKNRAAKASLDTMATLGKAIEAPEATAREMAKSIGKKDSVVWYMDGGKKRFFIVDDPYLLTAVTALDYAGIRGPIMDTMSMFKHALTIGVTASPFFKIRNLIRDSVQVVASGPISYNIGKNLKDGWKKTDPKSDDYFRLLAGGGTIHFSTMYEGSEAKRVQALVEAGVDESTILNSDTKLKTMYRKMEKLLGAYNELGNRGEAVNRAALYDQLIKRGVSHSEASLQARDLMDFSMQGSFTSVRFLTQVVPFMNARIQGLHKLQRAAKEDPQRFAIVLGAASLASLALLGAYGDDDDWKKRTESDRNNFWWFKMGGTAYRIPKPFEIGAIATLAERSAEYIFDKEMTGKRFREQIMQIAGDNLSMNPIPQAVKPILDIYANKDYQGMPIESMGMDRLASEYRFNDRTSMAARGISTAANTVLNPVGINFMSPVQVDHLVRGYFGWLGSTAVATADVLARPATGQPEQASADKFKLMTGGMVSDLRDAPSRYVSQMYDQAREIEQAYGTWRMLQKTGKPQEAAEFLADRREDLAKYKQIEGVKRAEAKFNERIRMIDRSNMPADNKRELIRGIQEQKTRVAMMVN